MARLDPTERANLPDRAFAYIDKQGRRLLPIHDPPHVRNALARFGQVAFEDDAACERARTRLLNAAKRFKIVPVGFIAGQLRTERARGGRRRTATRDLPTGFVTMMMTDIEGSTALVHRLGERYRVLLDDVCTILRRSTRQAGGHEIEARADEFFAVFAVPRTALDAAITIQRELAGRSWDDVADVRVRIGVHSGYPTITDANYIGLDVHTASRISDAGHGGQVVVSANTREAVKATDASGLRFVDLGEHRLRGLPAAVALYQIAAEGLGTRFPPLRTSKRGG